MAGEVAVPPLVIEKELIACLYVAPPNRRQIDARLLAVDELND